MGIVRTGVHTGGNKYQLGYGLGHGYLKSWPMPVKHLIVTVWNFIACRVWGHDWFEMAEEIDPKDGSIWQAVEKHCVACGKRG